MRQCWWIPIRMILWEDVLCVGVTLMCTLCHISNFNVLSQPCPARMHHNYLRLSFNIQMQHVLPFFLDLIFLWTGPLPSCSELQLSNHVLFFSFFSAFEGSCHSKTGNRQNADEHKPTYLSSCRPVSGMSLLCLNLVLFWFADNLQVI